MENQRGPIGIFDSGFGGLTVFKEIIKKLPQYDYLYLGDNARSPYGSRSFETVYRYTLECVKHLFTQNCHLIILACNTASAKALRTIQQTDLPHIAPSRRILGVLRPSTEIIGSFSRTGHVGILGTVGTIASLSYVIEIEKFFPGIHVFQEACPMWVPLIENNEFEEDGADYFVKKHIDRLLNQSPNIDVILLGCTHYPLLINKIRKYLPSGITLLSQGEIVAESLADYLHRHPEIEMVCRKNGQKSFFTTDLTNGFDPQASIFFGEQVKSVKLDLF